MAVTSKYFRKARSLCQCLPPGASDPNWLKIPDEAADTPDYKATVAFAIILLYIPRLWSCSRSNHKLLLVFPGPLPTTVLHQNRCQSNWKYPHLTVYIISLVYGIIGPASRTRNSMPLLLFLLDNDQLVLLFQLLLLVAHACANGCVR